MPFSIWKDDPVAVASEFKVTANVESAAIVVFPSNPELITSLQVNSSASKNVSVELFDVLEAR